MINSMRRWSTPATAGSLYPALLRGASLVMGTFDLALAPDEGCGVPVVGFGEVADWLRDAGKGLEIDAFLGLRGL